MEVGLELLQIDLFANWDSILKLPTGHMEAIISLRAQNTSLNIVSRPPLAKSIRTSLAKIPSCLSELESLLLIRVGMAATLFLERTVEVQGTVEFQAITSQWLLELASWCSKN